MSVTNSNNRFKTFLFKTCRLLIKRVGLCYMGSLLLLLLGKYQRLSVQVVVGKRPYSPYWNGIIRLRKERLCSVLMILNRFHYILGGNRLAMCLKIVP